MNSATEQISPAGLQKLATLAAWHGFRSINDFIEQGLPNPVVESDAKKPFYETASPEEWVKALREWATNHPILPVIADDSRETIYEGRGEGEVCSIATFSHVLFKLVIHTSKLHLMCSLF